jgi:hypothetical protein
MNEFPLYRRLSTRSRRAIVRTNKRYGHPYTYNPRGNLLRRLSRETGMTLEQVYSQLMRERSELIRTRR